MVTIKDGCGCDPCDCDWKQKLKEAYSRAIQSVNKIGDETGRVYFPDGTGFVKMPLPTKEQIDSIAEIDGIKASVDELNKTVPALETQVTGVTESLVSGVEVLNGTTAGKFKVRIEREKAALIDSNDYDLSKVNSVELIQGSGPAMVKAQLTLSDGTVLRSDDFLFTTENIGTDVYISSFTFKAGNVDGTISADIGLNNGVTIEANNFLVPTDPNIISSITDLQTRTAALEQNVTDINNKADLDNVNQVIVAKQIDLQSIVRVTGQNEDSTKFVKYGIVGGSPTNPFTVTQETEAFGQIIDQPIGSIALLDSNGSPKNFTAGGEVWEEVDLSNWPTDWVDGDRIKVIPKCYPTGNASAWNSTPSAILNTGLNSGECIEFIIKLSGTPQLNSSPFYINYGTYRICFCLIELNTGNFNRSNTELVMFTIRAISFNGGGVGESSVGVSKRNLSDYFLKIWRLKK